MTTQSVLLQCSKKHEMVNSSGSSGSCSICLTPLAASGDDDAGDPVSCSTCPFSVCSSCCDMAQKQQQQDTTTTTTKEEKKSLVVLEDLQSLCQQADAIVLSRKKQNSDTNTNNTNTNDSAPPPPSATEATLEHALDIYHQALSTRHNILGEHHLAVGATQTSIARAFVDLRHYVAALDAYEAAFRIYDSSNNNSSNNQVEDGSDDNSIISRTMIQNEINTLMDTMVDAANYFMMQGLELQARHLMREDALLQFQYSHSLLVRIVARVRQQQQQQQQPTAKNTTASTSADSPEFPSELELSLSLCHVCRVIASVHVSSSSQNATALPYLKQAQSLMLQVLGKDDERTIAMVRDVATLQALIDRQQPRGGGGGGGGCKKAKTNKRSNTNTMTVHSTTVSGSGISDDNDDNDDTDDDDEEDQPILHWFQQDDYDATDIMIRGSSAAAAAGEDETASSTSDSESATNSNSKPLGVSVDWIKRGLWQETKAANLDHHATMQTVMDKVVQPKMASNDTSVYLHGLESVYTGPALLMVIYAADSSIGEIVNSLDDYCRTNSFNDKNVHVWLACLCQSSSQSPAVVASRQQAHALMAGIGRVLAVISPWYDPVIWRTSSCLWEMYMAHQMNGCQLTLVLPPLQTAAVADALMGDPSVPVANLYKALDALHIDSSPEDAVPRNQVYHGLQELFRPWIRNVLMSQVQEHCKANDDDLIAALSPLVTADTRKRSPQAAPPAADGDAAGDVFKLQLCNKAGLLFWHYGEYKAALELLEDALGMTEAMYGEQHESTATVYKNIANVLSDMGRYEVALETYEKVLRMLEGRLPENHPKLADTCTKVGNLYRITGALDKAMEFHQRALAMHVKLHGSQSNLVSADSYNDIGDVLHDRGDSDAAVKEFRKALQIQESILGKSHPSVATTHSFIGMARKRQGHKDAALQEFQSALTIQEECLGEDHVEIAMTYENIASVMSSKDDLEGALDMCQKAKAIYEKTLGIYHPSTATTLQTLGTIQNDLDDVDNALQSYRAALDIRESVMGKEHLSVAETLRSIGTLLFEIGDLDDALIELRRAFDIMEPLLGMAHPTTQKLADTINEVLEA